MFLLIARIITTGLMAFVIFGPWIKAEARTQAKVQVTYVADGKPVDQIEAMKALMSNGDTKVYECKQMALSVKGRGARLVPVKQGSN